MSNYNNSVLIIVPNDSLSGAELFLKNVANYFLKEKFRVSILFLKKKGFNNWEDVKSKGGQLYYSKMSKETNSFFFLLRTVYHLSRKQRIQFTFSSQVYINGLLGLFRNFSILKTDYLIVRESTSIFYRFKGIKLFLFKLSYRIGYSKTDMIICQTDIMKGQLIKNVKKSVGWNIITIPNPIDLDNINQMSLAKVAPSPLDYGNFIVAAGRLITLKGFHILIDCFPELSFSSPLNLVILGDGPEKDNLVKAAVEKNVSERTFFPGHVANPIPYFKAARLCVVSSLIEGFPNVLLQMISQNIRVVATACAGGIEDIPGITTCPPNNKDALKNAMQEALDNNYDEAGTRRSINAYLERHSIVYFFKQISIHLKKQSYN